MLQCALKESLNVYLCEGCIMNRKPDLLDQAKMGKLPTNSFDRFQITMFGKKETTVTTHLGYHLHGSKSKPNDDNVHKNQLHIYPVRASVGNKKWLCTAYRDEKQELKTVNITTAHLQEADYSRIANKLSKEIPLSPTDVNTIMSIFKNSWGNMITRLEQNDHPLLQTMDDYIIHMQKKSDAEQVDAKIAYDKIEFTKTLRTFIENPNQENWHNVREAMKKHPRYGFSWTGKSQTDEFLTNIKLEYKKDIKQYDMQYDATHRGEAKTSWGRFVYNFGFLYYVPSIFTALYKLVQYIRHEMARQDYNEQLCSIQMEAIKLQHALYGLDQTFSAAAQIVLKKLQLYLVEEDLLFDEDTVTYIDEIDEHIQSLNPMSDSGKAIKSEIQALAHNIKELIPRPIPLRDMSSYTM